MSHLVPSLPTPKPARGWAVAYQPKHRRPMPADWTNLADCTDIYAPGRCTTPYCPRHRPSNYASHMARHATDSIPHSIR